MVITMGPLPLFPRMLTKYFESKHNPKSYDDKWIHADAFNGNSCLEKIQLYSNTKCVCSCKLVVHEGNFYVNGIKC